MKFEEFIKRVQKMPVIETEMLLSGVSDPSPFKVQISRWQKAGKLIQLKRGVYLLAPEYRAIEVYDFYLAFVLQSPSYVSLEKAFEYYDLIPEAVQVYTSVTTKRTGKRESEAGRFSYRHIRESLFWGDAAIKLDRQTGFIALPEKALLDYFYFRGTCISSEYFQEMRLQNLHTINFTKLKAFAKKFKKPGIIHIADQIKEFAIGKISQERAV